MTWAICAFIQPLLTRKALQSHTLLIRLQSATRFLKIMDNLTTCISCTMASVSKTTRMIAYSGKRAAKCFA